MRNNAVLIAPHLRRDPDLCHVVAMRDRLRISLEAAARCYVERHDAQLAVVFSRNGQVRYVDRQQDFPWIVLGKGARLNPNCGAARFIRQGVEGLTAMEETTPLFWIDRPEVGLAEQTRLGRDGFAVTMLWASRGEVACCRFRGHDDKIVTMGSEIGHAETEVQPRVQV